MPDRSPDVLHAATLIRLSDELRPLADPHDVKSAAVRVLGTQLGVNRALYVEVLADGDTFELDAMYVREVAAFSGRMKLSDFIEQGGAEFLAGRSIVIHDAMSAPHIADGQRATFAAIEVRAVIGVPLIKQGQLVAVMGVHQATPRVWTAEQVALVEEVAHRTWDAVARARAEESLRRAHARYRTLVENVRDYAIILLDASGLVTEWPAGAERMLGYAADEILGKPIACIYPDEHAPPGTVEAELAEAARLGRVERESVRVRKDGSRFYANEITTAIHDSHGAIASFTKVCRDLSEQRRLHAQHDELLAAATAARADAEAANRAKDDFLATLSHELRTPLTAILLWARALRSGAVPLTEASRAIDAIAQSAESQSQLVEDLLDMSRLISGKLALTRTAVDVAEIARTASDVIKPLALAKSLAFNTEIAPGLGMIVADGERLKQVLWNLLSNAIKFTPEGGAITLRVYRLADQLEIEISDDGAGIAPEFMPHIFQRFRQADMGETRTYMGLGIGLALSRQLVELHRGTIVAASEGLGRGARFLVRLPWIEPSREAIHESIRRTPRASVESQSSLRGLHVLLVEDDADTREAMRWMLARAGANVNAVATAGEALAALQGDRSLVVVSDLGLPGVSGFELVQRIARMYEALGLPPPPACAVSAHARDVDRQRAIDAGFDIYLAKPVTPERLVEAAKDLRDIQSAKRD